MFAPEDDYLVAIKSENFNATELFHPNGHGKFHWKKDGRIADSILKLKQIPSNASKNISGILTFSEVIANGVLDLRQGSLPVAHSI